MSHSKKQEMNPERNSYIKALLCAVVGLVMVGGARAEDQLIVPSAGEFKVVRLLLEKAAGAAPQPGQFGEPLLTATGGDLHIVAGIRDDKIKGPSRLSVRDIISTLAVTADAITGTYIYQAKNSFNEERFVIKAAIADGKITGTWEATGKKSTGVVSGTVKSEVELRTENVFKTKADWPCWSGPYTSMAAMPCDLKLVEDFQKNARLVWRSEEPVPQGPGNSLNGPGLALVGRSNGGGSSAIVHEGRVFVNYYQPAGTETIPGPIYERLGPDYKPGTPDEFLAFLAKKDNLTISPYTREKFLVKADDVVVCMDAVTGKTLWKNVFAGKSLNQPSHKGGCVNNTPCAGRGKVFAMGPSGCVHGMDIATGKVLWERTGMSAVGVVPWSGARNQCTAPIYVDGVLILPDHGSTLTGIDPETGKDLWKLPGKGNGFQVPTKCNLKGKEYVGSMTGEGKTAAAIEAKTGKILWEIPLPEKPSKGVSTHGDLMVVVSGGITTPNEDGSKALCTGFRLSVDKAEQVWQTSVPDANAHAVAALDGRYVVVKGTCKQSHLLDATSGKLLATYSGDTGQNECHVALMEDRVLLSRDGSHGSSDMTILGLSPETFSTSLGLWSQPHPQTTSYHSKYMTWPMVEGRIFMRGVDGVYCYDLRKK